MVNSQLGITIADIVRCSMVFFRVLLFYAAPCVCVMYTGE